jgi:hypothetical protein
MRSAGNCSMSSQVAFRWFFQQDYFFGSHIRYTIRNVNRIVGHRDPDSMSNRGINFEGAWMAGKYE